jgi:subtilisin family serine protease
MFGLWTASTTSFATPPISQAEPTVTDSLISTQLTPDEYEKVAPDLGSAIEAPALEVSFRTVVRLRSGSDPAQIALRNGGVVVRHLPNLRAAVMDFPRIDLVTKLVGLACEPQVESIAPNRRLHLALDPTFSGDSHLRLTSGVQALFESSSLDGSGVTIAVIDSGIADHPDLADRILARQNFIGAAPSAPDYDPYGHGTHVAGLAAGNGSLSTSQSTRPLAGVAPNAKLVDLRVLDQEGKGTLEGLLRALDWVYTNAQTYQIKVVNLSLGTTPSQSFRTDPLCTAVERLVDAGITVVAAAGNNGKDSTGRKVYGAIHSPGIDPKVITVGAANSFASDPRLDDEVASFSSRGPTRGYRARDLNGDGTFAISERRYDNLVKPDLLAPGNRLASTLALNSAIANDHPELIVGTDYLELSGTSMSTPVVSGIVALLLQANPDLTPALIKSILMFTAQRLPDVEDLEQGAGLVNALGALELVEKVSFDPATLDYGTNVTPGFSPKGKSTQLGCETIDWGGASVYVNGWYFDDHLYRARGIWWGNGVPHGSGVLWGDGVLYLDPKDPGGQGFTWSDGILWGDSTFGPSDFTSESQYLGSNGILWGDGFLIADGVLWGDGILEPQGTMVGDGVLWGDGVLVGDGILWGDGVLWGDGILWGDATILGEDDWKPEVPEVGGVTIRKLSSTRMRLAWNNVANAQRYAVYFGNLSTLTTTGQYDFDLGSNALELAGVTVGPDGPGRTGASMQLTVAPGSRAYALVTASVRGVEGTAGTASNGSERLGISACP